MCRQKQASWEMQVGVVEEEVDDIATGAPCAHSLTQNRHSNKSFTFGLTFNAVKLGFRRDLASHLAVTWRVSGDRARGGEDKRSGRH